MDALFSYNSPVFWKMPIISLLQSVSVRNLQFAVLWLNFADSYEQLSTDFIRHAGFQGAVFESCH